MMPRPGPDQLRAMLEALPADIEAYQRDLQDSLSTVVNAEYVGTAAGGQVEATCNGFGALTGITIHRGARELDNLTLGDAVAEAVRNATDAGRRALRSGLTAATFAGRPLAEFAPTFMAD